MSSLVTSASKWTTDENVSKKRIPSMRKTIKKRPTLDENDYDENANEEIENNRANASIETMQNVSTERSSRVNELLNKITSDGRASENDRMGDFTPITHPVLNVRKDSDANELSKEYVPKLPSYMQASLTNKDSASDTKISYVADQRKNGHFSNYMKSYDAPAGINPKKPYYATMGVGTSGGDDKLMEKINYMIHMLEEQQREKTGNITEEFLMYTFLGVFIIFVVDSFARTGRYTR